MKTDSQPIADAMNITVKVQGADVTRSGEVHKGTERGTVTGSAWNTPGVRNVIDQRTLAR